MRRLPGSAQPVRPHRTPVRRQRLPALPTATPTTMDQVVDRTIEREHALIKFLQTRTPLVETYLQNLKLDPQMGPSPKEDHYFFGRLDLSDSRGPAGLSLEGFSFQNRMMGGVTKLFKFEYKPIGFFLDDLCRPRRF